MASDKTLRRLFFEACSQGNVEKVHHCIALEVGGQTEARDSKFSEFKVRRLRS